MENQFNKVFLSFNPLNPEFSPGNRIIDTFSNCFSFHLFNKYISQNIKFHIQQLDKLALESSNSPLFTLIVIDANIKNNIVTSISHIYICNKPITRTLHCCSNHQTQCPMISLTSKSQSRIQCGKFTRELDKKSLLNQSPIYIKHAWSVLLIIKPALLFTLYPHVCFKTTMCTLCTLMSSSRSFYHLLGL